MATTCESSTKCVFSTSSGSSPPGLVIVSRLIGLPPRILRTSPLSPFSASSAPHCAILPVLSASHHTPSDGYKATQHRPSLHTLRASLVVQMAKSPPAVQATQGPSLGGEDPLEEGVATHSSILAWRIPWTGEPGGLLSIGLHRVGHDSNDFACMHALEKKMATHSSVLAWRVPGTEEPGWLQSMGLQSVIHTFRWIQSNSAWAYWQLSHKTLCFSLSII